MAPTDAVCPSCRQPQNIPPPPPGTDPLDQLLRDVDRTGQDFVTATDRLLRKAGATAKAAADDPSAAAHKAVKRFQKELAQAKKELEQALKELK